MANYQVSHEELTTSAESSESIQQAQEARLAEQKALIERLENDLLRLNGPTSSSAEVAVSHSSNGVTVARQDPLSNLNLGKKEQIVAPPGLTSTAETSILPIITSQRDRFRQRNSELEEVGRDLRVACSHN